MRRAVHDRRAGFRTPSLATVVAGQPRARLVVLRRADAEAAALEVHTDRRAAKVAELARSPRVGLVFWDARRRQQLRLEGEARVEGEGPRADAAWAALSLAGRAAYGRLARPGGERSTPGADPTTAPADVARAHFAVVTIAAGDVDWLRLGPAPMRRAGFSRAPGAASAWRGAWLEP